MLQKIEAFFAQHLAKHPVFEDHMAHPASRRITTVALIIFLLLIVYKAGFEIGVWLGWWEMPGKEYFVDTPVHCAHVYVEAHATLDGHPHLAKPLKYHVEFSPEEYDDRNPDLGSTLGFLRKKLYHLFKDSAIYDDIGQGRRFTLDNVDIYNNKGELITQDDKPLCLQNVETGNKIKVLCHL